MNFMYDNDKDKDKKCSCDDSSKSSKSSSKECTQVEKSHHHPAPPPPQENNYYYYCCKPDFKDHDYKEHDYKCCCKDYDHKPVCKGPEGGKAILSCGAGGPVFLPSVDIGDLGDSPIPVASANINTSALCDAKILLTFTGSIGLPATAFASISFVITKTCDNGSPQSVGSSYTFTATPIVDSFSVTSFSFQFCDCNSCDGCCTYTVSIAPRSSTLTLGPASVGGTLSILAVENK